MDDEMDEYEYEYEHENEDEDESDNPYELYMDEQGDGEPVTYENIVDYLDTILMIQAFEGNEKAVEAYYKKRLVDRYEDGEKLVSTARVDDGVKPYETAIAHPLYHEGKAIVVAAYNDRLLALEGHQLWVKKIEADDLPDEICEVPNAKIYSLGKKLGVERCFKRGNL